MVFRFEDGIREDARAVVTELQKQGMPISLLSGDRHETVAHMARTLGIDKHLARWMPEAKATYIAGLNASGRKVLIIGDGLNDAPALTAAHASMAPSSAADAGRVAADLVFLGDRLEPVLVALRIARQARRLVMQNFALAAAYNMIAVPIAVLGYASPLAAAIAMSLSSLVVTANALRLRLNGPDAPLGTSADPREQPQAERHKRNAA